MQSEMEIPASLCRDSNGRIDEDLLCGKCQYNLRGLDPAGCCSECGESIAEAATGFYLRFCDSEWLRTIASGALMLAGGIVLAASVPLFGLLAGGSAFQRDWLSGFIFLALLEAFILFLVGGERITRPVPDRSLMRRSLKWRQAARFETVSSCGAGILLLPISFGPSSISSYFLGNAIFDACAVALAIVLFCGGAAAVITMTRYEMKLAVHLGDRKLSRRIGTSARVLVYSIMLLIFGSLGMRVFIPMGGMGWWFSYMLVPLLCLIAPVVAGLMCAWSLLRLRAGLLAAAAQAAAAIRPRSLTGG